MSARRYTQFFNTLHTKPVLLDCNFIVDVANGNGYGCRSLKGPGIDHVFMHSSASFVGSTHTSTLVDSIAGGTSSLVPGMPVQGSGIAAGSLIASIVDSGSILLTAATSTSVGSGTITYQAPGNPNPALGHIIVNFSDNYRRYFGGFSGFVSPVSGSALTAVTANVVYVIVSLGTATLAQWQAKGVPVGITPAVGVAFVASATGTIGGSAAVETTLNSGVSSIELIGDPNQTIFSQAATVPGISSGAYIIAHTLSEKTVSFSAATHTNTTLDTITSTVGLVVGAEISGTGIPLGTTIASITNGTTLVLSQAATASATITATTQAYGVVQPADSSVVGMSFYLSDSSILNKGE